jgi:flagellar hook assembly protein FlgD
MRGGSTIGFTIPGAGSTVRTTLMLYDARGRLIRTLISKSLPAGRYTVRWDGLDSAGRRVAAGAYIYRLDAGGEALTRKLVLTH